MSVIVLASERFRRDRAVRFHGFQSLYLFVAWLIVDQVLRPLFGGIHGGMLPVHKILEAVLKDENRIQPVSSLLTDYRGISDVCLSVPCIVNRGGVETTLPIPMNANEEAGLKNSAETIRAAIKLLGF